MVIFCVWKIETGFNYKWSDTTNPTKKKTHKHTKKKQTKTRVTAKGLNQGFAISNSYVESG